MRYADDALLIAEDKKTCHNYKTSLKKKAEGKDMD